MISTRKFTIAKYREEAILMNKRGTIRRLLEEMAGRNRLKLVFVFIFILISTFVNISGSFFIQTLIDDYLPMIMPTATSAPNYTPLVHLICFMIGVYISGVLATFLYNRMMVSIGQGIQKKIRDNMFAHMETLPISYFDSHTHGDIMSHYTNDTDTLREFFSLSLPQLISSTFTILMVIFAMIRLSLPLFVIVIFFIALMLFVSKKMSKMASHFFMQQQVGIGDLTGYTKEMIAGQKVTKVFCHEKAAIEIFQKKNINLCNHAKSANGLTNMLMPIMMNIGALQYVVIAFVGGVLALNNVHGVTLGAIAAFLTLSKALSSPIAQISVQVNAVTMALAGAGRIFTLMDEPSEVDEGYVTLVNVIENDGILTETNKATGLLAWKHPHNDGSITYSKLTGDVRLTDVDFGYTSDKLVLRDVSLYAKPGQKIAFVGATGAGKTTITNLLNRFYDIADGQIHYDGININKIKKADLRRSLGIVLQDTRLFAGTVADNIRYGKLDATNEEIYHAATIANADNFIRRLPKGYDTILTGDESTLSSGQRQLLAIARAAVADPPVMILDEATSSIDTRTEAIVQQGMDRLMEGRTVFVIAHRLSTVKNSEAIMVLEHGQIIERGSHQELLNHKERYYQLYTGIFS